MAAKSEEQPILQSLVFLLACLLESDSGRAALQQNRKAALMRRMLNRLQDDTKGILSSVVVTGKERETLSRHRRKVTHHISTGITQQYSVTVLMFKICKYYSAK